MIDASRSIKACAEYYGDSASAMESYLLDGEQKALELGNRGPIKFDEHHTAGVGSRREKLCW